MAKISLWLIAFYRRRISPMTRRSCRFIPSCSEYAYQAIEIHGFLQGGLRALWRILRCNPFNKGGYDPVR